MTGVLLKSLAKEVIQDLPPTKPESVENALLKKGVKPEELKFMKLGVEPSGLKTFVSDVPEALDSKGRLRPEELKALELERADNFDSYTSKGSSTLFNTTVPDGAISRQIPGSYTERVITFDHPEKGLELSQHFPFAEDSYLMHTRMYDELIDGADTRVIAEIQSDLHQKSLDVKAGVEAPWKSSWMRKGMENEILHAIKDGKSQVAIPIKNAAMDFELPEEAVKTELDKIITGYNNGDLGYTETINQLTSKWADPAIEQLMIEAFDYVDSNATKFGATQLLATMKMINPANSTQNAMATTHRAPGVQKWYETAVAPTAQKLAKQIGADYTTVKQDGVEYAVLKLNPNVDTSKFTLYAGGAPLAAYMAMEAGYTEQEITEEMTARGFTPEEIADSLAKAPKVAEAKAMDYTDEEIEAYFASEQPQQTGEEVDVKDLDGNPYVPKGDTGDAKSDAAYNALVDKSNTMSVQDLTTALHTVYPDMSSVTTRMAAFFGDSDAAIKAQRTEAAAVDKIQQAFAARGVKAEFIEGEWYVVASDDNPDDVIRVTPGMWDSFWAARGEAMGALLGGAAGGKAGLEATAASPNPYVRAAAVIGGSVAGAVAGSVVGTELDYLRDALAISEDLSAEVSAHKALTAAEASVIGDLIGLGVIKASGSTWRGLVRAKDMLIGRNTEGARQALRDTMFLREDEIDEVVAKLSKVVDTSTMSRAQQEITATALLLPGTQDLVRAAGVIDPKASRAVVRAINDRADDVLETTKNLAGEGVPQKLYEDLAAYSQQTKEYYSAVKMAAATAPRAKYYKFNIDKAAIEPVFEQLRANIQDPSTLERFVLQVNKARQHANGRTFEDLIELRQLVNDFAFNKNITNGKVVGTLRQVIDNLDGNIERGAKFVFGSDGANAWLKEFGDAKVEYAKMKSLERNTLAKLVRRPGVQPELISKALLRYSNSVDGTYDAVMKVMPQATRVNVEGDMINTLAEKFSVGEAGQPRAVHFPALSRELDTIQFVTPEARKVKAALKELGDVFQNDVPLAESTGMMTVPKFQSYLTADPVVRAKFAAASMVFNYFKTLVPSEGGRQASLLKNTARFLETPLNAKTLKEFTDSVAGEVNLSQEILAVQQAQGEAIAKNLDKGAARVVLYGDSNILSTTGKGKETAIPRHRIASKALAQSIADKEAVSTQDLQAFDMVLSKYGFKAVEYGSDKVRLLRTPK